MRQLKVAVIGCGNVAPVHLAAATTNPSAQLIAVCDTKEERAKKASQKYGAPYYTDYNEVLALKPDLIHVCTPHHRHAEITIAAANKGIHTLTEKPMAVTLHDADRMIQAARDQNVTLGVIFQNRYNLSSLAVKEAVTSGALGKVLGGRLFVTWLRDDEYYSKSDWKGTWDMEGGGVLIDQAIHTMDLMQWIMGPIDSLEGSIRNRTHDIIHVEDVAEATVFFKNGAIGSLYACNFYSYDADVFLEVHGENGVARLEKDKAVIRIKGLPEKVVYAEGDREVIGKSYWGVSHKIQIDEFYADVLANRPVKIDGVVGRKALEFVRAIYYSGTHDGELVQFPFAEPKGFTPPSLTRR
ncbi:MAG TPA: gfo/Idh/MocA family oxidoreductase [Firmicutes bacterium]|nr:gfo/Idh/MocA family oxidoreductase [Bacillota bacterium]